MAWTSLCKDYKPIWVKVQRTIFTSLIWTLSSYTEIPMCRIMHTMDTSKYFLCIEHLCVKVSHCVGCGVPPGLQRLDRCSQGHLCRALSKFSHSAVITVNPEDCKDLFNSVAGQVATLYSSMGAVLAACMGKTASPYQWSKHTHSRPVAFHTQYSPEDMKSLVN